MLKDDWKSVTKSNPSHYDGCYDEYFSPYELPNNRLILKSFSEGTYRRICWNAPSRKFSVSKIAFINLINFEEITSTETFEIDAKYIIFENIILIQAKKKVIIYDINLLNIINNITLKKYYGYLYKYNE